MLNFDTRWRFRAPADDDLHHGVIPTAALDEFRTLISRLNPDRRQSIWEAFKLGFRSVTGHQYGESSNSYFAQYDCDIALTEAAGNAPLFIEAFYESWLGLQQAGAVTAAPLVELINFVLNTHQIGYSLAPPELLVLGSVRALIAVNIPEQTTLADTARERVNESLGRASELIAGGQHRAAVMETLWLLDSVSTVFHGIRLPDGEVRGAYFNTIISDLRRLQVGGSLPQVLRWIDTLYGYLSAPAGGQIRHGMDLSQEIEISPNEARLYCNLIRSYIDFLLTEYERLVRA